MMLKVYIAQYLGSSITSRLIQFGTRFPESHSALLDLNAGTVWEAWKKGVDKAAPWEHHDPKTPIKIYSIEVTVEQRLAIELFLVKQKGKKYDLPGVLGWPLPFVSQRADRWFCSELIFAAFEAAGIHLLKRIEAGRVSPGLLSTSPLLTCEGPLENG